MKREDLLRVKPGDWIANREGTLFVVGPIGSGWWEIAKLLNTNALGEMSAAVEDVPYWARRPDQVMWPSAEQYELLIRIGQMSHEKFARLVEEGKVVGLFDRELAA